MQANKASLADILQTHGTLRHYHVPKYQREYTWGKNEWEQLLNDIDENEPGYFMGSIICIVDHDFPPGAYPVAEIVDGQQRLTTISLLLMAIFKAVKKVETEPDSDLDLDDKLLFFPITKQIVIKESAQPKGTGYFWDSEKYCFLRVQPSTQKHNYSDYLHILKELNLIKGDFHSKFCKVRRLYKAYDYLYSHIPKSLNDLKQLLNKIHSLNFVYLIIRVLVSHNLLFFPNRYRSSPPSPDASKFQFVSD